MIGLGKTTTSSLMSKELNIPVYYESVDDNKVLPLYYSSSEEEIVKNRYPFLLQLTFLTSRYRAIKEILKNNNAILDRSIYEDYYFTLKNHELDKISDLEFDIYKGLFYEFEKSIIEESKKDIIIYLKGDFNTVIRRIKERGRVYELDDKLIDYYHFIWKDYDEFVLNKYKDNKMIIVDVTKKDIALNKNDRRELLMKIKELYER